MTGFYHSITSGAMLLCVLLFLVVVSNPDRAFALSLGGTVKAGGGTAYLGNVNKPSFQAGGGFVLDNMVSTKDLLNYRFSLSCSNLWNSIHKTRSYPYFASWSQGIYPFDYKVHSSKDIQSVMISLVNTLGFGVLRKENSRLWIGPEISLSTTHMGLRKLFSFNYGGGPVLGYDYVFKHVLVSIYGGFRVEGVYRYSEYKYLHYQWIDASTITPQWDTGMSHEMGYRISGHISLAVMMRVPKNFGTLP